MKTTEEAGRRSDCRLQIADFRLHFCTVAAAQVTTQFQQNVLAQAEEQVRIAEEEIAKARPLLRKLIRPK